MRRNVIATDVLSRHSRHARAEISNLRSDRTTGHTVGHVFRRDLHPDSAGGNAGACAIRGMREHPREAPPVRGRRYRADCRRGVKNMDDGYNRIPIIKLWHLLLVPLQGELTDELADRMTSEVLERIYRD